MKNIFSSYPRKETKLGCLGNSEKKKVIIFMLIKPDFITFGQQILSFCTPTVLWNQYESILEKHLL